MTNNQVIELEYPALIAAAKKITGGHQLHMDLLHHSIEELYNKPNSGDIIQSGGLRFYLEIDPATLCLQCVGAPQGVTACLLHNESASYCQWPALAFLRWTRSESEYEMCV